MLNNIRSNTIKCTKYEYIITFFSSDPFLITLAAALWNGEQLQTNMNKIEFLSTLLAK